MTSTTRQYGDGTSSIAATVTVTTNLLVLPDKLKAALAKRMDVVANDLRDRVAQSLKVSNAMGMNPSPAGEPPGYGIGDLVKSLYWSRISDHEWRVGCKLDTAPQARLLEFGGRVGVRNKEWLTIPASREAIVHKTRGGTAREFPKRLAFVMRNGNAYLIEAGRGDLFKIHYILKKSVFIPAHPFLRPAAHDAEFKRRAASILGNIADDIRVQSHGPTGGAA